MKAFKRKLEALGLTPQQIDEVCALIGEEIIGSYELAPIPNFARPADIKRFQEQDNDVAVRNALRREQRKKLV